MRPQRRTGFQLAAKIRDQKAGAIAFLLRKLNNLAGQLRSFTPERLHRRGRSFWPQSLDN